jgi:CPA1 family monovalent cation:H+ antiporter
LRASDVETIVGLLAVVALLAQLARRLRVPYPIVLVLAGLVLAAIPGLEAPTLDPETFFLLFLPPLLYSEAFLYSTEALRAAAAEIALLAVGLVLATAAAVAVVAHLVAGLPWAPAFALGAVVGPTDPVSATTIIRRLGVSESVVTILEGESLVNDGTALVLYKLAIAAAGAAAFSIWYALGEFVWVSFGGVAIGILAAALAAWARRWITVMEAELTLSLLMPFVAYLPAERLGVSGVLAAVTAGVLLGSRSHETSAGTRLRRHAFWDVVVFVLNSLLFLLIGLAMPEVLGRIGNADAGALAFRALVLSATVIGLRVAWMLLVAPLVAPRPRRELIVLGWSGMRGGVSLAAALAVPVMAGGHPFPARDEIVFFAYAIMLATLVIPGLTLGPLIDRLGVASPDESARGETQARAHILQAALEHIDELAERNELPEEIAGRLRELYESRLYALAGGAAPAAELEDPSDAVLRAQRGVVAAQRAALAELAAAGDLGDAAAREVGRELDVDELGSR